MATFSKGEKLRGEVLRRRTGVISIEGDKSMSGPVDREGMQQRPGRFASVGCRAGGRTSPTTSWWSLLFWPGFCWKWVVCHGTRLYQRTMEKAGIELSIQVGSRCAAGVMRETNEDRCYADSYRKLFAVADGVGESVGESVGGERASQTVIEVVASHLGRLLSDEPLSLRCLEKTICETLTCANTELIELAQRQCDLTGMGSTLTLGVIYGSRLLVCHIGDSRAYLYRDQELQQLTCDDTLVQGLVATGTLTAGEANRHPMRQVLMHRLSTWPLHKELRVDSFGLCPGDRLLFTTDGLTDVLTTGDLKRLLDDHQNPQEAANQMIGHAELAGSSDNATCIVVNLNAA